MQIFMIIKELLSKKPKAFLADARGGIVILAAIGIMVLLMGFKLAIDMGSTVTTQANIQQTLRNSLTTMGQELVYMWIRCETGASERPNNVLKTCVSDEAALAIMRGVLQTQLSGTKDTFADAQVEDMRIVRRPEADFLYARVSYNVSDFFPTISSLFISNSYAAKTGKVESGKVLRDRTAGGCPGPTCAIGGGVAGGGAARPPAGAVYMVVDSGSHGAVPAKEAMLTTAMSLANQALTNLEYNVNIVAGGHRYAQRVQCPLGGCGTSCTQDARGYSWDGSCSADNTDVNAESGGPSVAVHDRLFELVGEFYAQPIRTCPSGTATWTFKERQSNEWCKHHHPDSDFTCSYDYEDNCRDECKERDMYGNCTREEEECDRHRGSGCSACSHTPSHRVDGGPRNGGKSEQKCNRCTGGNWHQYSECWEQNHYREVVWYHTCNQATIIAPNRGGVAGAGFDGLYVDVHQGDRLRFIAKYIGPTEDGEPSDYPNMPPLVGTVSAGSENMPKQTAELGRLRQQNSREMIPWQCNISGSGAPGAGGNIVMQPVYGGQEFYSPTPDNVADCISGGASAQPYKVTFRAEGCNLTTGTNCDIKQGYWKIFAVPNLRGPWPADPMRSNVILGRNGPLGPGPSTTGNCDRTRSWCSEQTTGACNGYRKNDQAGTRVMLDKRYSDPVIAQPPHVLGEQIYMSSISFEIGRPNNNITGVYIDKFNRDSAEQPRFTKNQNGSDQVRFANEFGSGDGMLVLNSSDNGKEIPIGMWEASTMVGNNAGGQVPKSSLKIQSLAALKGADGITPLNNLPMGATVAGLNGWVSETRDYSRISSNYSYGMCAALSGAKKVLMESYGPETTKVILYAMHCRYYPYEDAGYGGGKIHWSAYDNDLYQTLSNGRLQSTISGSASLAKQWQCTEEAARDLMDGGGLVFPINIGADAFGCPDHQAAMSSDVFEDTKIGQQYNLLDGTAGHTQEDLAADIAWLYVSIDRGFLREVAADNLLHSFGQL